MTDLYELAKRTFAPYFEAFIHECDKQFVADVLAAEARKSESVLWTPQNCNPRPLGQLIGHGEPMKLPPLPPGPHYAYLVLWSQTKDGPMTEAGVYTEETPTSWPPRRIYSRVLAKTEGRTCAEALDKMARLVEQSYAHLAHYPHVKTIWSRP